MKIRLATLIAFMTFWACDLSAQENPKIIYNLDECIQYALQNNENLQIAKLDILNSKAVVGETRSQGLPQISASASWNKNLQLRTTYIPAKFFDPNAGPDDVAEVRFGTPYDGDLGVSANQMIFNGSYFVGLQAANTYKELSELGAQATKIDVIESVKKSYYAVLLSNASLEAVERNYARLDTLLRETRLMYENGLAEKIDVSRVEVEYNNIKTNFEASKRMLEVNSKLLKLSMGMPNENEFSIADKLDDLSNVSYADLLKQDADVNRRVELQQINTNIALANLDLKYTKSQYLPQLDLHFAWGRNAGAQTSSDLFKMTSNDVWFDYSMAGLTLTIPIFSGLKKSYIMQQNRIAIQKQELTKKQTENMLSMEVIQVKANLLTSIETLSNNEANVKLAEEVYNVAKIKFQNGVGSNLELIEADATYKTAQNNYYQALYDALSLMIDYEKALGILSE